MIIWRAIKWFDKCVYRLLDWSVDNLKIGIPIVLFMIVVAILGTMVVAAALNVAIDVGPIEGTFSGTGAKFDRWLPAILGLGIILFAFSVIMKHVNANIEAKKTASKDTEDEASDEKTNDTSS